MTLDQLDRKDARLLGACALIAVVSLFVGVRYYFRAFPEASMNFRVSNPDSKVSAEKFLEESGFQTAGYRHASVFGFDDDAKTFLERELGVAECARLFDTTIRLWRWQHRWFRPLEKEEFAAEVTTRGELVGFRHDLPEDAPGGDPEESESRAAAEIAVARFAGRPLTELSFVEATAQKRPQRTDHTFVWKLAGLDVHGADYRYEVTLAGEALAGYREYLNLPDAWVRDYQSLRSHNDLAALVAGVLLVATMAAMLVLLVMRMRRGDVRWKTATILGGITALLLTASQLNALPGALYEYDTHRSFGGFLAIAILQALAAGGLGGIAIFLYSASGEPVYRERFPGLLSLSSLVTRRVFASREFFVATVVGLTLTCFFFAYENVFYIAANAMGAWSPREVPYSDLLSTAFPWAFVLFFGWFPAVSEEFTSRMFSIPFIERLGKSTTLAVIVSAFIWGFAHSNYPNQPFFIRGLEVGLAGVMFGLVFLRFGILSVVVCHFSVDALYAAFALLRSPSVYQQVSGALAAGVFVLALLVAVAGYVRRGGFVTGLPTNADEGSAPQPSPVAQPSAAPEALDYRPLSRRIVAAALLAAAALAALSFLPVERFGDWVAFNTNRGAARTVAAEFLSGLGYDVAGMRSAVTSRDSVDPDQAQYLQSTGGMKVAERFYRELVPTPYWVVRFFTPGQHEEYSVRVGMTDPRALGFLRVLPDDSEGASLEPEAALEVARAFLAQQGVRPEDGERKEQTAKDEKARRDHTLVWEFQEPQAGEARLRQEVVVQGDRVGTWLPGVKVPESWERERAQVTVASVIFRWLKAPVLVLFGTCGVLLLVASIRTGKMAWKAGLKAAGCVSLAWMIHSLLAFDRFWGAYVTSIATPIFLIGLLVGLVLAAAALFGLAVLLGALAAALYPEAVGMFRASARRRYGRDAVIAGLVALASLAGVATISDALGAALPAGRLIRGVSPPAAFEAALPFLEALCLAVVVAFFVAALGAVVTAALGRQLRQGWLRVVLVVAVIVAFVPSAAVTVAERVVGAASVATWTVVVVALAAGLLRANPLAWVACPFLTLTAWNGIRLASSPDGFYRWNGAALLALVVAVALWLTLGALRSQTPLAAQTEGS